MRVALYGAALASAFFLFFASAVHAEMVSVAKRKVNMRSGPGKDHDALWMLDKGFPLQVLERQGNWIKVQDFEQDSGWVHDGLVTQVPHMIVKGDRINVRSGPGTNFKVLSQAEHGVVFRTLQRGAEWVQVRSENGLTGWVKRDLVWGW